MRQLLVVALALVTLVLAAAPVLAIDLVNEDDHAHDVVVTSSAMEKTVRVSPRSLTIIVCVGACTFRLADQPAVSASGSDEVTISNGRVGAPVTTAAHARR